MRILLCFMVLSGCRTLGPAESSFKKTESEVVFVDGDIRSLVTNYFTYGCACVKDHNQWQAYSFHQPLARNRGIRVAIGSAGTLDHCLKQKQANQPQCETKEVRL